MWQTFLHPTFTFTFKADHLERVRIDPNPFSALFTRRLQYSSVLTQGTTLQATSCRKLNLQFHPPPKIAELQKQRQLRQIIRTMEKWPATFKSTECSLRQRVFGGDIDNS